MKTEELAKVLLDEAPEQHAQPDRQVNDREEAAERRERADHVVADAQVPEVVHVLVGERVFGGERVLQTRRVTPPRARDSRSPCDQCSSKPPLRTVRLTAPDSSGRKVTYWVSASAKLRRAPSSPR